MTLPQNNLKSISRVSRLVHLKRYKEGGYKFLVGNPVYLADFLTVEIYYLKNMPKSNIKANVSSNLKLRATVVIKLHDQLMHISH